MMEVWKAYVVGIKFERGTWESLMISKREDHVLLSSDFSKVQKSTHEAVHETSYPISILSNQ